MNLNYDISFPQQKPVQPVQLLILEFFKIYTVAQFPRIDVVFFNKTGNVGLTTTICMFIVRDVNVVAKWCAINKGIFERCHRLEQRRVIDCVLPVFHSSKYKHLSYKKVLEGRGVSQELFPFVMQLCSDKCTYAHCLQQINEK